MFLGMVGSMLQILPHLRFRVWIVYHTKKSYVAYDGAWVQVLMHFGLTSYDAKKDWKRFPLMAFYDSLEEAYLCVAEDMEILAEVDGAGDPYYFHSEEEEEHSLHVRRVFD